MSAERMPLPLVLSDITPVVYRQAFEKMPRWRQAIAKHTPFLHPEVETTFKQEEDWLYSEQSGEVFLIPAGFVSDYASIPQAVQSVIPKMGPWNYAAWLHDWLYKTAFFGAGHDARKRADLLLMELMVEWSVDDTTADIIYRGVRVGGGSSYGENKDIAISYRAMFYDAMGAHSHHFNLAEPVPMPELIV